MGAASDPLVVVDRFVACINSHDVPGLVSLMTPDHVFVDSLAETCIGAETLRAAWGGYFDSFPDYALTVSSWIARDDVVAIFGVGCGTYRHVGRCDPADRWSAPVAILAKVRDGLVAEWRVFTDNGPAREIIAARSHEPALERS